MWSFKFIDFGMEIPAENKFLWSLAVSRSAISEGKDRLCFSHQSLISGLVI